MFDHSKIQNYSFEDIPLDRDILLMDEQWMVAFEAALLKSFDSSEETAYSIGYYSRAAARSIGTDSIELSWYPDVFLRFHEMGITLPRSAFIRCVGSWQHDYMPLIFVRGDWLTNLYLRSHSVFALVDAIGVKEALASAKLTRPKLIELRSRIDEIAGAHTDVAFMSFADSLLLKSNYSIGQFDSDIKYTYQPEKILRLLPDIQAAYQSVLGLNIYAVVTQGINEYYDDGLVHTSNTGHHISFNSLGLPFAQTQAIEHCARAAIRSRAHLPADAYLDEKFYHSLRWRASFNKNVVQGFPYTAPMTSGPSKYFPVSFSLLVDNLEPPK